MLLKLSLLFSLILHPAIGLSFQCRDQNDEDVDWCVSETKFYFGVFLTLDLTLQPFVFKSLFTI